MHVGNICRNHQGALQQDTTATELPGLTWTEWTGATAKTGGCYCSPASAPPVASPAVQYSAALANTVPGSVAEPSSLPPAARGSAPPEQLRCRWCGAFGAVAALHSTGA